MKIKVNKNAPRDMQTYQSKLPAGRPLPLWYVHITDTSPSAKKTHRHQLINSPGVGDTLANVEHGHLVYLFT